MNRVKELLQAGQTAIGTTAGSNSEVAFLADAGFDFLLFDTQHSLDDIKGLNAPLRAMRRGSAEPIIRVGDNRPDQICYALDAGAKGLVVPMVNNAEEATNMVKWCKYPFEGERSSAGIRGDWGKFENYREYMDAVNEQLLIIPMIETVEAMDNLQEIAAVPGVDVLLVGPSDLSINLDVALDYTNPKYRSALERIGATCAEANIAAGMFFVPPGIEPSELIEMGIKFFTQPWGGWAKQGIQRGLAGIR
ncbi:MAG: aldolase/citrate lyase family protein [Pseudomonadota bacterium]